MDFVKNYKSDKIMIHVDFYKLCNKYNYVKN
jgi:hypothetical protein